MIGESVVMQYANDKVKMVVRVLQVQMINIYKMKVLVITWGYDAHLSSHFLCNPGWLFCRNLRVVPLRV